MVERACIHILCGKPGSGKTTYARALEADGKVIRLSADELMLALFTEGMPRPQFEDKLARCKELLLALAERLLRVGVGVVLDWGFWSRAERCRVRARFEALGIPCVCLYFDVDDATLLARLDARNRALPPGTYRIDEVMFRELERYFEEPAPDEGFVPFHTSGSPAPPG